MYRTMRTKRFAIIALAIFALSGCSTDTDVHLGDGASIVTGSSSTVGSTDAATQLAHCDKPLGTAALVEHQDLTLIRFGVSQPVPLIKLMMQQSGCFLVVDRDAAMHNTMMDERGLEKSGELRAGSNFGGGQIVPADFSVTPSVIFSQKNSRGTASGLAFLPVVGEASLLIGAAGLGQDSRTSEAQTTLAVTDNRSGIQVAMAEGSASKKDLAGVFGVAGGYTNTDSNKVVAAGFLDAYNKMVVTIQSAGYSYKPQPAQVLQPQQTK